VESSGRADTSTVTVAEPKLESISLTPGTTSLQAAQTVQFSVSATWSDGTSSSSGVTYSAQGGTITAAGLYTAGSVSGTYRVIAATASGPADTSYVTVVVPTATLTSLSLTPASVILAPGAGQQLAVSGSWSDGGSSVPSVTYSATGGAVTSAGYYTAGGSAGTYRVIATHAASGKADTSFVTVTAPSTLASLTVSPGLVSLAPGAAKQFALGATWSNGSTTPPAVTWTATGGTISTGGLYVAGPSGGTFRVIATQQGGTLADTADVSISGAVTAPTLTGVSLSPGQTTVLTGGAQQFTASGQYSDGTTGAVSVTWTATGGTVSSLGLYQAGNTQGTYRVIAAGPGGLADTATIAVVTPVTPPAGIANEPAGYVPVVGRRFNSMGTGSNGRGSGILPWLTGGSEGWDDVEYRYATYTSQVTDATAPFSSPNVLQFKYPAATFPSNFTFNPGVVQTFPFTYPQFYGSRLYKKLYMRTAFKVSANFQGHPTSTNKLVFIRGSGGPRPEPIIRLRGVNAGNLVLNIDLQGSIRDPRNNTGGLNPNTPGATAAGAFAIQRGRWYVVEIVLDMGTTNGFNGKLQLWLDGVLTHTYSDVEYAPNTTGTWYWDMIHIAPTWGGQGGTINQDFYLWFDEFYVSGAP
ncbi:MAG: hypothetical protein ACRENB_10710, partial [Gemmatimonadales bacterium]